MNSCSDGAVEDAVRMEKVHLEEASEDTAAVEDSTKVVEVVVAVAHKLVARVGHDLRKERPRRESYFVDVGRKWEGTAVSLSYVLPP